MPTTLRAFATGTKHGVYGYAQSVADGTPKDGRKGRKDHQRRTSAQADADKPDGPRLSVQIQCDGRFAEAIEHAAGSGKAGVLRVGEGLFGVSV